jgi:hypothetical protein
MRYLDLRLLRQMSYDTTTFLFPSFCLFHFPATSLLSSSHHWLHSTSWETFGLDKKEKVSIVIHISYTDI